MESVVKMEKWSVDKLNGGNWITWKFQMRHLLLAKGLWKYVDGSETFAAEADERTAQSMRNLREHFPLWSWQSVRHNYTW